MLQVAMQQGRAECPPTQARLQDVGKMGVGCVKETLFSGYLQRTMASSYHLFLVFGDMFLQ